MDTRMDSDVGHAQEAYAMMDPQGAGFVDPQAFRHGVEQGYANPATPAPTRGHGDEGEYED